MANQAEKQVLGAEDLIGYLLKEPKILQKVLSSLKPQAREYTQCKCVPEEERVYFGKYNWSGFGGFWNNLIKCCDHITYDDLYLKIWDALVEMTAGTEAHEAVIEGLSREVLIQGIHAKDQNILHRFFDVCRHLTSDGYWRDKPSKRSNTTERKVGTCPYAGDVEIEVQPQQKRNYGHLTVRDAVGDIFEVINVNWLGGRR